MKFTKMQGIGNDYVYVNCFKEEVKDPAAVARFVSDRHFGIGSDGLILIRPSEKADCTMDMYNLDGSQGAMCGNGIRCVAKYAYDYGIVDKTDIAVETKAGIKYLHLTLKEKEQVIDESLEVEGKEYYITGVSMGNPHAVIFLDYSPKELELEKIGPSFENHKRFPDRINTEFVHVLNRNTVEMRVWERGSGETMACGTGACAVAVASILNGFTEDEVTVKLLGGDLKIFWDRKENLVYMTGPATTVFDGEIELPEAIA